MKKLTRKKSLIVAFGVISSAPVLAQPTGTSAASTEWHRGGNTASSTDNIFGWPVSNSQIWHQTNGFSRMVMYGGTGLLGGGRVGFGNSLPTTFSPVDRLHSHTSDWITNMFRFTNLNTGLTNTDGFRVGVSPVAGTGPGTGDVALFDQYEQTMFRFDMRDQANLNQLTKVTIDNITQNNIVNPFQATYTDAARVGIWEGSSYSTGAVPMAMVHVGSPILLNTFGHRDWMNIGTWYNTQGSDGMYVGIRETANNGIDAVIAFGDDGAAAGTQGDRLMFIFNSQFNPTPTFISEQANGLEVARMVSNLGNDGAVLFNGGSIGNFDPQNTVHIVGQGPNGNATTPGGNSGLRFEYLNSTTPTIAPVGSGVLSVDANGDVIYVTGGGGTALGNYCGSGSNPLSGPYEIPLANNNFYFNDLTANQGSVSIGNNSCTSPIQTRLDVLNSTKSFAGLYNHTVNQATTTGALQVLSSNTGNGATGGIQTIVSTTGTGAAQGIQAQATSTGASAIGITGISQGGATNAGTFAIGVNARSNAPNPALVTIGVNSNAANGSSQSFAGNFDVIGSSSPNNYGLQTEILTGTNATSNNWGYDANISTTGGNNTGINFNVTGASNANNGFVFHVSGPAPTNTGGYISTTGGSLQNFGFNSTTTNVYPTAIADNWAVIGLADNQALVNGSNVGVYGEALLTGTASASQNVGVVGISRNLSTSTPTTEIGVYGEGPVSAYFAGPTTSGPALVFSDANIKKNVETIENGLDLIKQLRPVTYDFKSNEYPALHLGEKTQYGFIAQEVEKVIPELVSKANKPEIKDRDGKVISGGYELKGLNYDGIIPVLTKGMQEQQTVIEEQEEKINDLQKQIDELKKLVTSTPAGTTTNGETTYDVELSDKLNIVLEQNVPNPFAEQTTIGYSIPENCGKAQMLFYNAGGQLIKAVDLTEKGKGHLNVFASDLSNGTYTYTLVVDGKIVQTRKMERQK